MVCIALSKEHQKSVSQKILLAIKIDSYGIQFKLFVFCSGTKLWVLRITTLGNIINFLGVRSFEPSDFVARLAMLYICFAEDFACNKNQLLWNSIWAFYFCSGTKVWVLFVIHLPCGRFYCKKTGVLLDSSTDIYLYALSEDIFWMVKVMLYFGVFCVVNNKNYTTPIGGLFFGYYYLGLKP